jgi:HlyD family secretion protein
MYLQDQSKAWFLVLGVAGLSALSLWGYARRRHNPGQQVVASRPVLTASGTRVGYRLLAERVLATGTVAAVDPLALGPEVSGLRVEQVMVEEGDEVRAGQVLVVLNRSLLEAQRTQLEARLRSSRAQTARALQPQRPQELAVLDAAYRQSRAQAIQERANLEQARVNLAQARASAARYQQVLGEGYVTVQEAADRQAEVERSQQLVQAARHRWRAGAYGMEQALQRRRLSRAGGRREDVDIAQAAEQELSGALTALQVQLDQTVVRAPSSGLVLKRDVHLGDISSSGKAMFTLARRGEMELQAQLPQADLFKVRVGTTVQVCSGTTRAHGRIWRIAPLVEAGSRLGTVRIQLQPGSLLRPGMFAQAWLPIGQRRSLAVPSEAVLGEGGDFFAFRLEGETAVRTRVTTGLREPQWVEVLSGLEPGQFLIVGGARFLSDGDRVRIESQR